MSQIVQPDFFSQGGISSSPYVLRSMGRYRNIALMATSITKVEVFVDGSTYIDITANTGILNVTTAGLVLLKDVCFQQYRITFTGTLFVNAN